VAYYARWCGQQHVSFLNATPSQVSRYVASELSSHARSTAMNRLLAIRSWYRYLCVMGHRKADPTAAIPVKRDKLQPRRPFTFAELEALLAQAITPRDRALLLVLMGTGCRRGELVSMRAEDIDWARGRILLRGKGGKERWTAPGSPAMQALAQHLGQREGVVWQLSGQQVYTLFRRMGKEASVVGAYPHRLRVSFAVSFLHRYGDLAALRELLGHQSLRMAEHYAQWGMTERALMMQAQLNMARPYRPAA